MQKRTLIALMAMFALTLSACAAPAATEDDAMMEDGEEMMEDHMEDDDEMMEEDEDGEMMEEEKDGEMMEEKDDDAMEEKDDDTAEVKSFTFSGTNFKFAPNAMTVNEGDTVRVTFKNDGGTHDFVIDEFGVQTKTLQAGESETVEFVANKSGSFEFYCSIGNHRAQGMVGTLTVN